MCKHACTPGALDTACKWDAMQVRDRYTNHTCRVHAGTVCAETCCSIADHSVMCEQLDQHMDGRQRPDSCCNSLLHPGVLNACTAQFVTTLGRLCCGWMELDTETPIKLLVRLQPAASKVRKRTARTTTGSSPVRGTRSTAALCAGSCGLLRAHVAARLPTKTFITVTVVLQWYAWDLTALGTVRSSWP